MNYKTIMICTLLAGSMQNAYAMEDERSEWGRQSVCFFEAQVKRDQVLFQCNKEFSDWQTVPQYEQVRERVNALDHSLGMKSVFSMTPEELAEHTAQMEDITKDLEIVLSAYHDSRADRALVGAKLLVAVRLKYEGMLRFQQSSEFKELAPKIAAFDKRRSEIGHASSVQTIDLGIAAGYHAREMMAAIAAYESKNKK